MILIRDATIVGDRIIEGDILIEDGRIREIGKDISEKADETIDAKGKIAIPGLVNTHTHVAMTLFRGYGEDLPLHEWLQNKIWPAEAKMTAEDIRVGSLLAYVEMIKSGITCFNEMYIAGINEMKEAAEEVGMRGVISLGLFDLVPGHSYEGEIKGMKESIFKPSELVRPAVSCHAPYTCSKELIAEAGKFAKEKKLKFHMHVSETRKEMLDVLKAHGKYPFEYLDELGVVHEDSIFAHASWVTKREIALVGKRKATISNNPESNLKLATGGICPVREYIDAGANLTLGTDGAASNNSLSIFETMKLMGLLQKHRYWKADILPTGKIFESATINGAKALGFDAGVLREGKLADITLLKRDVNLVPEHDIIANLIYAAEPQNVNDIIINGKLIMRNREMLTVDEEKIKKDAEKTAKDLVSR